MQCLWLENQTLRWRDDVPHPEPGPGEGLVRVLCAGVCNTDVELLRGYYPFTGIPGHEFVGRVEGGAEDLAGRRVVGEINAVCGRCRECLAGRRRHCPHRSVLGIAGRNGAFAEYLILPAQNLHPVPDSVDLEAATFVEPLAAALQIQQQVQVRPDDRVAVVGDGKLGLLVAQTLALTGCRLLAIGRHPTKLGHLTRRGIRTGGPDDLDPSCVDVAVECTGAREGFALARRALRPGGTLVLKSTYAGLLELDVSSLVVDEIRVVGSRCGPFAPALRLLAAGQVEVAPLIHARYPLEQGIAALGRSQEPGVLKVLLRMENE